MKKKLLLFICAICLSFIGINSVEAGQICYYRLSNSYQEIRVGLELDDKTSKVKKASLFWFYQKPGEKEWLDVDKTSSPLPEMSEGINMDVWGPTTGCPNEVDLHRNSSWASWWYHVSVDQKTNREKDGEWYTLSRVALYPVTDGNGNFMEQGWEQILTGKTLYDENKILQVFHHWDKGIVYKWGDRWIIDEISNSGNFVKKFTDSDGYRAYYVFDFSNAGFPGEGSTILIKQGVAFTNEAVKSDCDSALASGFNYTCIIHPEFRLQSGEVVPPVEDIPEKATLKTCSYDNGRTAIAYIDENNEYSYEYFGEFTLDEQNVFKTVTSSIDGYDYVFINTYGEIDVACPVLHQEDINQGDKVYGCDVIPEEIREWILDTLDLVKYVCLVLVIVLGILDFIKAAASGEADAMKKSGQSFLKRVIAVVILFLLPVLVELILNLIEIYGVNPDNPLCTKQN